MSAGAFLTTVAVAAITLNIMLIGAAPAGAAPDLASVRELYASASYAEALEVLGEFEEAADNTELVEQYRALCLLGLGRTADAEQALERIVMHHPLYVVPAADVSPRLVTLFHDVRRRSLPGAARQMYVRAKASYDSKDHEAAAGQFKDVLALVNDPDAASQGQLLAELKQLAEGFLALSEAAVAAAAAPPPPLAPLAPPPVAEVAKAPSVPRVYTTADSDVVAPQAITRAMPGWRPPSLLVAQQSFRGVLEVIVNEQGIVEWAGMSKPSFPSYDGDLIPATKSWRFRPATKDGEPVKYRLAVEVLLLASREE
jgi:tetratricopeptide (TPR) repeat protein